MEPLDKQRTNIRALIYNSRNLMEPLDSGSAGASGESTIVEI